MPQALLDFERRTPASTAEQVYVRLREAIIRGELRPGQRLSENELSERLRMSRTPVREAFIRLRREGFLQVRPQAGTFVSPILLADVEDSQFLRETLECRTIALAAEHCTQEEARALERLLEEQAVLCREGNHHDFVTADDTLHQDLIKCSRRPSVWKVVRDAKAQLDRVRYLSLEDTAWLQMIFRQHQAIVRHVVRHDQERAVDVMREHLRTVFQAIERIAARHPEFFAQEQASALISAGPPPRSGEPELPSQPEETRQT